MVIDPAQLRMLALVGAHGSMTAAAAELGVTAGALTGQVARAEQTWGVPLVLRGPRGARLTEAGAALARQGHVVDEACRRAALELGGARNDAARRVRIGSFLSVALRVLPDAMTALRHHRPDSDLTIIEGTSRVLTRRVADGDLDLAVIGTYDQQVPDLPGWLTARRLLSDPMVVCLPEEHRLARTAPDQRIRLAQLRGESWVAILAGDAAREQLDRVAAAHGLAPRVVFQTESYDVAQAMVGAGLGVAVLARLAVRRTPGATHRGLERPRLQRRLWAVHARDTRLTPLVDELVALLVQVCDELADDWAGGPLS